MMPTETVTKTLVQELKQLSPAQLREVQVYVFFLKARHVMNPKQLYFWTRQWQAWEREADADKRAGRLVGDGTLPGLFKALRRR
jgi:hypothetical protein